MSYSDSLRQQAQWIRDAMDPATPDSQRIDIGDVDVDELEAAADEIEQLRRDLSHARACTEVWMNRYDGLLKRFPSPPVSPSDSSGEAK